MADDDSVPTGSTHPGTRIARLAPGEVASRTFGRARNGISEPEVRDFLQRIAGEIVAAREYERELEDRIAQLEDQVRLASAADPAGEVAAAEARAAEILAAAEEEAREQGRAMVNEARAVRKRMIDDAEQRRTSIEAELQALGGLRSDLRRACDALRDAMAALGAGGQVAASPAGAETGPEVLPPPSTETGSRAASVFARLRGEPEVPAPPEPEPAESPVESPVEEPVEDAVADAAEDAAEEPVDDGDDAVVEVVVEEVVVVEEARVEIVVEDLDIAEEVPDPETAPISDEPISDEPVSDESVSDEPVSDESVSDEPAVDAAAPDDGAARRSAREEAVAPATEALMRRAKRVLQDDQNEFLDAMRRQKSKVDPDKLLPGLELQVAVWAEVLAPAVDAVYDAGRRSVGGGAASGSAPRRLVSDLAEGLVVPLRDRLLATVSSVLDEGPYEPASELHRALGAAVGARYREWRSQDLEPLVGDLLAAAYARGAFDAAPAGARLRWIAAEPDHCPDCDDNALESTVKGQPFPTGQTHPPAHPGCRCMVALAEG